MATKTTDAIVLELFHKVQQQKEDIKKAGKTTWLTSCTLQLAEGNTANNVNIQTIATVKGIVDIYAFLLMKQHYVEAAYTDLNLTGKNSYLFQGHTFGAWETDIKRRLELIQINTKKEELSVLEGRLDKLISPEQRRELELAEIQKMVG